MRTAKECINACERVKGVEWEGGAMVILYLSFCRCGVTWLCHLVRLHKFEKIDEPSGLLV